MQILVKFPTRSRPQKFIDTLHGYMAKQITAAVKYLVSIDEDDETMNNPPMLAMLKGMGCQVEIGNSPNKIHAINRDMDKAPEWDILVLGSDDMICVQPGWDAHIISEMLEYFPDTDGVLWHSDGYVHRRLNTMVIMGRKYADRFGYIYNPEYISLWCDNEFTEVADMLGKQKYFPNTFFQHEHWSNTHRVKKDALMQRNDSHELYHKDKQTYERRKALKFGLNV